MSKLKKFNIDIQWGAYRIGTHSCTIMAKDEEEAREMADEIDIECDEKYIGVKEVKE